MAHLGRYTPLMPTLSETRVTGQYDTGLAPWAIVAYVAPTPPPAGSGVGIFVGGIFASNIIKGGRGGGSIVGGAA